MSTVVEETGHFRNSDVYFDRLILKNSKHGGKTKLKKKLGHW